MTYRNASKFRAEPTDAERKVWNALRDRRLSGYKFRRQHPIGRYVADFVCIQGRLVIELDGGQHADQVAYDERRTRFLATQGYRVLRFWNPDALRDRDSVIETILYALEGGPSPGAAGAAPPSPQRGEGWIAKDKR